MPKPPVKLEEQNPPPSTGRPTDYHPRMNKIAERMSWLRGSNVEIGAALGVSETTIRVWAQKHPAFKRALEKGRDPTDAGVVRSLAERAMGYSHKAVKVFKGEDDVIIYAPYIQRYPPDTAAAVRWLEQRRPEWKKEAATLDVNLLIRRTFLELGLEED